MELKLAEDKIILQGKELSFSETADKLSNLSARQMVEYFTGINIKLPKIFNTAALRAFVLNRKVKIAKTLNLSDEMIYRLRFYPDFTEYQLQLFYKMTCGNEDYVIYKNNLFKLILMNTALLGISDEQIQSLIDLEAEPYEDFNTLEETIMPIFYDFNKEFDGVRKEVITNIVRRSATAQDIRDLGKKYGINIPKRLKRNEMQSIIEEGLKKQHKLTVEMKEKLDKLPIINLQRVAKQNGIKVSIDLKKEDLIAYLLNEVEKAKFETRSRLIYNTDLGDDFEFDLSYVMAVEEIDEFVLQQKQEDEKTFESVFLQVEEEPVEKVVEQTIEKVVEKEEPKPTIVEEVVVKQAEVDYESINKAVVEVVTKEVSTLLGNIETPEPKPTIINIYNANKDNTGVQTEVNDEEVVVNLTLNKYPYENFDEQLSPLYDAKIAESMTTGDLKTFKGESKDISTKDTNVKETNNNEKIDDKETIEIDGEACPNIVRNIYDKKYLKVNKHKMKESFKDLYSHAVDPLYFDQTMRLHEYDLKRQYLEIERAKRRRRKIRSAIKTIIAILFILLLVWFGIVCLTASNIFTETDNWFFETLINPVANWLREVYESFQS